MKPATAERASRVTVAGPHDTFRRLRETRGLTKRGLARAAGLSSAYVAQLERGNIASPSATARAQLARALSVDIQETFVGFPPAEADTIAARRQRELELYDAGHTHAEIATVVGISESVVGADLRSMPGYVPRPTRSTYRPRPGCILASHAAAARSLDLGTLCDAIRHGEVPGGFVEEVAEGSVYVVDEEQLDAYIAARPECEREGCSRRALVGSRACCGGHASGLATIGSRRSFETRGKIGAAKRGRPRPDVAAIFRDPVLGAKRVAAAIEARDKTGYRPSRGRTRQTWLGKANSTKAPGPGAQRRGRPAVEATAEQVAMIHKLRGAGWGRRAIASRLRLGERLVRNVLSM